MTEAAAKRDPSNRDFDAARVDCLYGFGRAYLSLPFAALCVSVVLFVGKQGGIIPFLPLVLQIAGAVAATQLSEAYRRREDTSDHEAWRQRYISMAALNGAFWGVAALFWYVPGNFPAQACLALAFMGMIAAEFIARATSRAAFLSHAGFALAPFVARLLMEGDANRLVTALLLLCFAGVLAGYSRSFAALLDETLHLKSDNAALIARLQAEKDDAEAARDLARDHDARKTEFVATVSHELRTPLAAMHGMAQLLDQTTLAQPQRGYVRTLCDASQSLKLLLDDIIAMTTDGREGEGSRECDPLVAARSVLQLYQPMAWRKKLNLTVNAGPHLPRVGWGPRGVRQALSKLVENALKFTESGCVVIRIEPMLRAGRSVVRFSVDDTGPGVPPEIAPTLLSQDVFDTPHFVRPHGGAGLGLAVVKRIIHAADGEIGFDSVMGRGTSFWFTIPAANADAHACCSEMEEGEAPSDRRLLVCLDGETGNRSLAEKEIEEVLAPSGNRVSFAKTTAEAMQRAQRERFDAILVHAACADMLAAAPGDKAPILALVPLGAKRPQRTACLGWPTAAARLYGALNRIFVPQPAAEPAPSRPDLIDFHAISGLEKSVGEVTLIGILQSYLENAAQLTAALLVAAESRNWDEATRLTRDIAGSAGGLGLNALAQIAKSFAASMRADAEIAALASEIATILETENRTRKALIARYPDLAA